MAAESETFPTGAQVQHKAAFLRSVGWYTNVPPFGTVVDPPQGRGVMKGFVWVEWENLPDPEASSVRVVGKETTLINAANLKRRHAWEPN